MRYYSLVWRVYFCPYNHVFRGWVRVDPSTTVRSRRWWSSRFLNCRKLTPLLQNAFYMTADASTKRDPHFSDCEGNITAIQNYPNYSGSWHSRWSDRSLYCQFSTVYSVNQFLKMTMVVALFTQYFLVQICAKIIVLFRSLFAVK